jgi:monoamine oxidase
LLALPGVRYGGAGGVLRCRTVRRPLYSRNQRAPASRILQLRRGTRAPFIATDYTPAVLDAIVVGAGLSGLVCARRLVDAGAKIAVLEARDRVGGRLHSGRVGGALVDLGGQWMTPGQPRLAALARELGVDIERHDRSGRVLVDDTGGLRAAFSQWWTMRRIERLMKQPARDADQQSLADWLRTIRNADARDRIGLHADLVFACDPSALSLLFYLQSMNATSGFRPQGTDEYRFTGGAQRLALALGEQVGDRIHINERVTAIAETANAISVNSYVAKRAVLAIPPPLVRSIAVELAAPARRYVDSAFGGPVVKCFASYERAYWRERGLSGESYFARGTVRATVEIAGAMPVLLAFVVGAKAARWASREPAERRADVVATFAQLCDHAPLDYLECNWGDDPWSAGCVPGLPPGALSAGARWREVHGRLHIAGTESAAQWPGYMEGAIEAGERAASEVLAAL